MNKVGTITFHASHNYGSMLQAWALQQVLCDLGFDPQIINLRTSRQKQMYELPHRREKLMHRKVIRFCFDLPYMADLRKRREKFENFLSQELKTGPEFSTIEQIEKTVDGYQYFICGSDQIWNTGCEDFDPAFFLPFVKEAPKISYAASMGPDPANRANIAYGGEIKNHLESFAHVSVRENEAAEFIYDLTGRRPRVVLDPTMLIDTKKWSGRLNEVSEIEEPYIFFYTPFYRPDFFELARAVSLHTGLEVVDPTYNLKATLKYPSFIKKVDTGPWEFLRLLRGASLVVSGSFHATVFSLLFHVPFISITDPNDSRSSNLLKLTRMQHRAVKYGELSGIYPKLFDTDFSESDRVVESERRESLNFLKMALNG